MGILQGQCYEGCDRDSRRLRTKLPATTASTARMTHHGFRGWVAAGVAALTGTSDGAAGRLVSLAIGTCGPVLGFAASCGLGISTALDLAAATASRFALSSATMRLVSARIGSRLTGRASHSRPYWW